MIRLPDQSPVETFLVYFDVEAQHGATWGEYHGRIFFGAALQVEGGEIEYLPPRSSPRKFAKFFEPLRDPGAIVVAHNASYDLQSVSGESVRLGFGKLPALRVSDTCKDVFAGSMYGKSLDDLAAMMGLPESKGHMGRFAWEAAYRGEKWALEKLEAYNRRDVELLPDLRAALIERKLLTRPYGLWRG